MPRRQRRIASWDCETDPFKYNRPVSPFINGFYDGEIYRHFVGDESNIPEFVEFLRESDLEYIIYAHNGGKFDFHFLLPYLDPQIKIINGRIAKATMTLDRPGKPPIRHEFRDSWLILPLPLAAHAKDEFDYRILERPVRYKPENLEKIKAYLKSDCIYLHEWVSKFVDRFGRKLTLASAAFDQLEKTGYEIPPGSKTFDERMRPYYYGGRVEAIAPGIHKRDLVYYDINSAYPDAMLYQHPYCTTFTYAAAPPEKGPYFARILAISKGCLPYRDPDGADRSLFFPRDATPRVYNATSWEIEAGIETGTLTILAWLEVIIPDRTRNFAEYVNKFYAEKLEAKIRGDKDSEIFAKFMLNSCYGKFGMDPSKFKESYLTESCYTPPHSKTGKLPANDEELEEVFREWRLVCDDNGYSIWERDAPGWNYYNVATAASITGFVRAKLWRAICAATFPVYCDTDALMAAEYSADVGNELGQMKLEGNIKEAYIGGKKLYAVLLDDGKWKTAHKGARLTVEQICKICAGEMVTWQKEAPSFSLRFGQRFIERNIKMLDTT